MQVFCNISTAGGDESIMTLNFFLVYLVHLARLSHSVACVTQVPILLFSACRSRNLLRQNKWIGLEP